MSLKRKRTFEPEDLPRKPRLTRSEKEIVDPYDKAVTWVETLPMRKLTKEQADTGPVLDPSKRRIIYDRATLTNQIQTRRNRIVGLTAGTPTGEKPAGPYIIKDDTADDDTDRLARDASDFERGVSVHLGNVEPWRMLLFTNMAPNVVEQITKIHPWKKQLVEFITFVLANPTQGPWSEKFDKLVEDLQAVSNFPNEYRDVNDQMMLPFRYIFRALDEDQRANYVVPNTEFASYFDMKGFRPERKYEQRAINGRPPQPVVSPFDTDYGYEMAGATERGDIKVLEQPAPILRGAIPGEVPFDIDDPVDFFGVNFPQGEVIRPGVKSDFKEPPESSIPDDEFLYIMDKQKQQLEALSDESYLNHGRDIVDLNKWPAEVTDLLLRHPWFQDRPFFEFLMSLPAKIYTPGVIRQFDDMARNLFSRSTRFTATFASASSQMLSNILYIINRSQDAAYGNFQKEAEVAQDIEEHNESVDLMNSITQQTNPTLVAEGREGFEELRRGEDRQFARPTADFAARAIEKFNNYVIEATSSLTEDSSPEEVYKALTLRNFPPDYLVLILTLHPWSDDIARFLIEVDKNRDAAWRGPFRELTNNLVEPASLSEGAAYVEISTDMMKGLQILFDTLDLANGYWSLNPVVDDTDIEEKEDPWARIDVKDPRFGETVSLEEGKQLMRQLRAKKAEEAQIEEARQIKRRKNIANMKAEVAKRNKKRATQAKKKAKPKTQKQLDYEEDVKLAAKEFNARKEQRAKNKLRTSSLSYGLTADDRAEMDVKNQELIERIAMQEAREGRSKVDSDDVKRPPPSAEMIIDKLAEDERVLRRVIYNSKKLGRDTAELEEKLEKISEELKERSAQNTVQKAVTRNNPLLSEASLPDAVDTKTENLQNGLIDVIEYFRLVIKSSEFRDDPTRIFNIREWPSRSYEYLISEHPYREFITELLGKVIDRNKSGTQKFMRKPLNEMLSAMKNDDRFSTSYKQLTERFVAVLISMAGNVDVVFEALKD